MAFLESYNLQGTGVSEPDGTNLHVSSFFVLVCFLNGIMYGIWRGNLSDGGDQAREAVLYMTRVFHPFFFFFGAGRDYEYSVGDYYQGGIKPQSSTKIRYGASCLDRCLGKLK